MDVKTKNTLFSFFGHIFEHFESSIFAFSGVFIATYFFPDTDDTWLGRYGIYVAISSGFMMAPLGALVFSWIGDKYGRRPALIAAYISGVIPTLIIPFIPSYALIGFTSSGILIACRFLQGIGSGGGLYRAHCFFIRATWGGS